VSVEEVEARHEAVLDAARPDAVAKQRRRGMLTARERIALLLDDGETLLEYGGLARPAHPDLEAPADAVVVGTGRVHGRVSVVVSFDYTVLGASQGVNNHAKTTRAAVLARQLGAPLFMLTEGGGGRAQEVVADFFVGGVGLGDFHQIALLSGQVPLIGVALGRAFAGHAIFLGESDVIIATKSATIGVAGPPLVKASTGQEFTPEQIGGWEIHERAGGVDSIVDDDAAAIAAARRYAHFFVEPLVAFERGDEGAVREGLRRLVPECGGAYESRQLVELVADPGAPSFELRPTWAASVATVLARIGGRAVGLVASNPAVADGALDANAADKVSRFVYLCDAFGLPLVFLVDTPGFAGDGRQALVRHAARIPIALSTVRVPLVTVVVGRAHGLTQTLLGGGPWDPQYHALWPGASYRGLGLAEGDPRGTAFAIAEQFQSDDVIDPGMTRDLLLEVLGRAPLQGVREQHHFVDPW